MLKSKDNIKFNALDIDYTNVREFIDGNIIAKLGSEKKKKVVKYDEIPSNLKNAYVAIEDERFYSHHGVDVTRTLSAIGSYQNIPFVLIMEKLTPKQTKL